MHNKIKNENAASGTDAQKARARVRGVMYKIIRRMLILTNRNCFLFGVLMMPIVQGCVPYLSTYRYISLEEVEGISVVEKGRADISQIYSHTEMPLKYELDRELYTLYFTMKQRYATSVRIIAKKNDAPISIEEKYISGSCGGFRDEYLKENASLEESKTKFYMWGSRGRECIHDRYSPNKEHSYIVFDVIDENGKKIGSEKIPFKFIVNGKYISYDAI